MIVFTPVIAKYVKRTLLQKTNVASPLTVNYIEVPLYH